MGILDLLRHDKAQDSATLREAIAKAEAEAVATATKLQDLTQARAAALLTEDNAALDRVEADLAQATRHADRLDLASAELRRRLERALADEKQAELDSIHEKGQAAARRGVTLIHNDFRQHALAMLKVVRELNRLHEEVDLANQKLMEAGYPRTIPDFDREARPVPRGSTPQWEEPFNLGYYPIVRELRLPSSEHPWNLLWPPTDPSGVVLREQDRPAR